MRNREKLSELSKMISSYINHLKGK